jgi:glycosyltransferase involved in cell wall biosynthesis
MRVLLVVHHRLEVASGAAGATLSLAEALRARGHDVTVKGLELLGEVPDTVATQRRFPRAVRAYLRAHHREFDVVDASTGDLARVPRRRVGWPLLVTRSHGLEMLGDRARRAGARRGELRLRWRYFLYHGGWRLVEVRRSLRRADLVVALNHDEVAYFREILYLPSTQIVLSAPVPGAGFGTTPPSGTTPAGVLVIGGDAWRKGVSDHLAVVQALATSDSTGPLGWLGGVPDDMTLALGDLMGRVTLHGAYRPDELGDIVAPYGVVVALSRFEGFGLTVLEAMSHGLVPVVTDAPGPSSFVTDGVSGFVVPVADRPAALAAVRRLADGTVRTTMATQSFAVAQSFAPDVVVDQLLHAYQAAIASRS